MGENLDTVERYPGQFVFLSDRKTVVRLWEWSNSGWHCQQALGYGGWGRLIWARHDQLNFTLGAAASRAYMVATRAEAIYRVNDLQNFLRQGAEMAADVGTDWVNDLLTELGALKRLWGLPDGKAEAGQGRLLFTMVRGAATQALWEFTRYGGKTYLGFVTTGQHKDFQAENQNVSYFKISMQWLRLLSGANVEWAGAGRYGQAPTVRNMHRARIHLGQQASKEMILKWLQENP